MKKRYDGIDIAKGIAIILVVFVHSLPNVDADKPNFNNNYMIEYLYNFSFLFFMPLFFFVSGFLSTKIFTFDREQSILYIKNKFKKLMIPYFMVSIMGCIVKISLSSFALRSVSLTDMVLATLFSPWEGSIKLLWFIYTLFIISVISVLLRKVSLEYLLAIFTITSILPVDYGKFINIDGVLQYIVYYYLGMYFFRYYEKYKEYRFKHIISVVTLIVLILINNINVVENYKSLFLFVSSLIGIICFLGISMLIENTKTGKILQTLGKHSLDIYLFSWFFQSFFRILLFQILNMNYNITFLFMFIGGFLPLILTQFIRKNLFLSKVLLGTTNKTEVSL